MKVTENNNPLQLDAYTRQLQQNGQRAQSVRQEQGGVSAPSDKVNLSSAAVELQRVAQQVDGDTGVVNDETVQKVKMEVDKGTYKVVGAQVATDMLKESFENDLILQKINTRV